VLESLTGLGLATSAGLNAYIPLMAIGLLARYTDLITLPSNWAWMENGWTLTIVAVLLAIEFVADKIPMLDHVNDVIQTFIRPTAGGLAFGAASSSETVTVTDPGSFFTSHQWVPIVVGGAISLGVHGMKAATRPVVNATTVGFGAPIVSTIEDFFSAFLSVIAIVLPIVVLLFVLLLFLSFGWLLRRRKKRKEERAAAKWAASQGYRPSP
jgi:uncharacterized membrane protein